MLNSFFYFRDMSAKEKAFTYHRRKVQKKEQSEMYSLWVDCLYKLSIGHYVSLVELLFTDSNI